MCRPCISDNNFRKKQQQCIKLDFAYNRNNRGIDSNNGFQKREFYTQRGVVLVTKRIKITKRLLQFCHGPEKKPNLCVYTISSEISERKKTKSNPNGQWI